MNIHSSIPLPREVVLTWSRFVLASVRHVLGGVGRSTYLDDIVTAWVISLDQGETAMTVFAHALAMCEGEGEDGLWVGLRALPEASGFEVYSIPADEDCDCPVCSSGPILATHWGCVVDLYPWIDGDPSLN